MGLAHNDLQKNFVGEEAAVAQTLAEYDIFVEINQSETGRNTRGGKDYYRYFSYDLLSSLQEYQVKVAIGTDVHRGYSLGQIEAALTFVNKYNLRVHDLIQI